MFELRDARLIRAWILSFLLSAVAIAQQEPIARARALMDQYYAGQYDAFLSEATAQVKAGITAAQLRAIAAQVTAQHGAYESIGDARLQKQGGFDVVIVEALHADSTIDWAVVLDGSGKLAGFRIADTKPRSVAPPPDYADASKFTETNVTVRTGRYALPGKLTLPRGDGPFAGVVLVHGSGPHDADETIYSNKPFRDLAQGLATRGIATLRYTKRTRKYGAQLADARVTLEIETIDDALSAVELLREHGKTDPARIFILGHSLGGLAAPYIAQRDDRLAGMILIGASARPIADVIEDQLEYLARTDGHMSAAEREQLDAQRTQLRKLREGEFDRNDELLGAPLQYWQDIQRRDPATLAATLKRPTMVLHGGRDYQVTDACMRIWRERIGGRPFAELRQFDNLNHLMMPGEGQSSPAEYREPGNVDRRVIETIAKWIEAQAVASGAPASGK